ncbi:glycosyl transferase family 51 [Candidatus Poribacteria bacterium]|nr:glycosyl transferase family 51 [Candidatus Poribacteria bacterium]
MLRLRRKRLIIVLSILLLLLVPVVIFLTYELRTSRFQSRYLVGLAKKLNFWMEPGPSPAIRFPQSGPYDERLGYSRLPAFIDRLTTKGYKIEAQARFSPSLLKFTGRGFFTTYHEKNQAGLTILDSDNQVFFANASPEWVYSDFNTIPDVIVNSLLFIENRELLEQRFPYRNPAVEWDRLANAAFHMGIHLVNKNHKAPGGSTLATQIEKYRHSPEGRTSSAKEKFRQMVSASLRSYLNGRETLETRRQIILDYINSIPLGAVPGYGEIIGLGDGLWAWYGADFNTVNRRLANRITNARDANLAAWALAYKQMLSLFLAQRRPSFYLLENHGALEAQINSYVRLLAEAGILSPVERDAVWRAKLNLRRNIPVQQEVSFVERKAVNSIRADLLSLLGVSQIYELNRLDLTVNSTIDTRTQEEITRVLCQLQEPTYAATAGLRGYRLLERGDSAKVIYSFTLYERTPNANLLRVQADNFNQPLNINEGIKLELGSSAKLRTLITYLEIIADLHQRYAGLSPEKLRAISIPKKDLLSQWAIDYLASTANTSLSAMLKAAMERRYSSSTAEVFFTGGGEHTFANFDDQYSGGTMSVSKAFHNSVNLVFIRLMRDIVRYYIYQRPGIVDLLEDVENPRREEYLARFADKEGQVYLNRFYRKYQGKSSDEALEILLQRVHPIPSRVATVFRSVAPEAGSEKFASFMRAHLPNSILSEQDVQELYDKYSVTSFSLADRGYIARVHPLELWTVAYLRSHPKANQKEVIEASADERQEVYNWLFKTRKRAQDIRIQTLVEAEAFQEIHQAWKRLGYPFDFLVPSYATAIGSSGDRPAALAELVGIILNGGVSYPSMRAQELHFAKDTPYETILKSESRTGERVLLPEIATIVRDTMIGVVEKGTAKRLHGTFLTSDGSTIAVGGKTGTGDNRRDTYGSRGRLIQSQVINRTAIFVFCIGDRFFGTIIAYVPGQGAAKYKFTSALPVQVLKILAPKLMPLLEREISNAS